jgi:hypothetical protein
VNFEARKAIYEKIEQDRSTKVLAYITGDRRGLETQISADCIDLFVDLLDRIGPTKKYLCSYIQMGAKLWQHGGSSIFSEYSAMNWKF